MHDKDTTLQISRIANRAIELAKTEFGLIIPKIDMMITLEKGHEACPMNLDVLESFDDVEFSHDVMGLYQHVSREVNVSAIEDCFVPRSAKTYHPG